jgi:hypothetical protein
LIVIAITFQMTMFLEPIKTPFGKLADFAILSAIPLMIDRTKIADIRVVETIKKGKSIYRIDPAKTAGNSALCVDSSGCSEQFVAYRALSPLARNLRHASARALKEEALQ